MKATSDKEVRERLVARGAEALNDEELLSLLIGSRTGLHEEAIVTAQRIMATTNNSLPSLSRRPLAELRQTCNLGLERASRLTAAFELGRRLLVAESGEQIVIKDCNDITALFAPLLGGLSHEEMWALYLTSANRVIERRKISVGGSSAVIADCKLVVKRALELVASSIILVHNHPSGSPQPSSEDRMFTERLKDAAALFEINLIDHVIISAEGAFSFRNNKQL